MRTPKTKRENKFYLALCNYFGYAIGPLIFDNTIKDLEEVTDNDSFMDYSIKRFTGHIDKKISKKGIIMMLFRWSTSKEGGKFWSTIYRTYGKIGVMDEKIHYNQILAEAGT